MIGTIIFGLLYVVAAALDLLILTVAVWAIGHYLLGFW